MEKTVYLISKRFDNYSNFFKRKLYKELKRRGISVKTGTTYDFFNFRKHKIYAITIGFDFYRDDKIGCGLNLNKNCSSVGRKFAYDLSNNLDKVTPNISWRDFIFSDSDDKNWFFYFNKVSSPVKMIYYPCTISNIVDKENYFVYLDDIINVFVEEITKCLLNFDKQKVEKIYNNN